MLFDQDAKPFARTEIEAEADKLSAAVDKAIASTDTADKAALLLARMAENDDVLFKAIARPSLVELCKGLVQRKEASHRFLARRSVRVAATKTAAPPRKSMAARIEAVASVRRSYWLDFPVEGRRLGSYTGYDLLPIAERKEKVGRTELATARFLRSVAERAKTKIVAEALAEGELAGLYKEAEAA